MMKTIMIPLAAIAAFFPAAGGGNVSAPSEALSVESRRYDVGMSAEKEFLSRRSGLSVIIR